nr:hypothetical protein Q903MT_gene1455 [Picea sitchensis]
MIDEVAVGPSTLNLHQVYSNGALVITVIQLMGIEFTVLPAPITGNP